MKQLNHPKKEVYNRSLERALQILDAFSFEKRELSLADLSRDLHLPKATVYRLCSTLIKYGYLKNNEDFHTYSLGLKLFILGGVILASFSLRKAAAPHLTNLQLKTGETIFLGILENDELIYIDKREDERKPIRFTSSVGSRRPAHWGMLGQVLMAFLGDEIVENILKKNPLKPFARESITDDKTFRERLQKIREQGFNVDREEALEGVAGVSAPIRDHTGKVVAAVGVGFISSSENPKKLKQIIKEACRTGLMISQELGFRQSRRCGGIRPNIGLDMVS
ncbi:MAG TPA: IclR family transcriptional regulator [Thermodesulfobacteriota bacterium]|nr:IclR family transcriptional regulator [Thermodesulfobacteriota bacterium]